jgi:3',5'-nucleoside bisphosphate phosphatase
MVTFRADLHCHSTCSDGSLTPLQLLELAAEEGLNALSITDHDSIQAYTPETLARAEQLNIVLVPGVEFSTGINNTGIHLLGYNFSLQNPDVAAFCADHANRRTIRCRAILKRLANAGMPVDENELLEAVAAINPKQQNSIIGRPHIAQMMIKLGYVQSIQEAFKKYLGEDCPCYVQGEHISPEKTIEVIHKAGGVAIIAHPHLIKKTEILKQLLEMNFDGIECYYSKFPMDEHQRWVKIAKYRNWLITGGSDFHGDIKPAITLGCSWIDEEHFNRLQNRDLHRSPRPSI